MIELFLDDKPAVLTENVNIKLTKENVYFTKTGSYTYDIELPLQVKENRSIFGNINRKDVETSNTDYHAVLRVDNVTLLDGKAVINQVTDTTVKIQLLGGNSEMNFYTKGENIYVDELDLGDWENEMSGWPQPTKKGTAMFRAYIDWLETTSITYQNAPESQDLEQAQLAHQWWKKRWWAYTSASGYDAPENRGVAFPVINSNSEWNSYCEQGLLCNEVVMRNHGGEWFPEYRLEWPNQEVAGSDFPQVCPALQPMLCRTLRKILAAVGYPLVDDESLRFLYQSNGLFRRIFIVCANNRREIAKALPHWTVNEFLTQIERFLGIVIEIDEITKTSRIVARNQWWNDVQPTIVEEVVDEYSVEIDKNETTDITNGNVGFDGLSDAEDHLSNEIMEVATIDSDSFSSLAEMQQYLINGASADDKNKIFDVDGHHFVLFYLKDTSSYVFKEVNQLRPLLRKADKKDVDVALKIVPAQLAEQKVPFVQTTKLNGKWFDEIVGEATVNVLIIEDRCDVGSDLVNGATSDTTDLQALIEGEASVDKSSEIDKMFVAIIPEDLTTLTAQHQYGGNSISGPYPVVYPYPRYIIDVNGAMDENPTQSAYLMLSDISNVETIGNQCTESDIVIDTTVKCCMKFISHKVFRPTGVFIINNKQYACEKLEYTITSKGISPLVTGYFYRLN